MYQHLYLNVYHAAQSLKQGVAQDLFLCRPLIKRPLQTVELTLVWIVASLQMVDRQYNLVFASGTKLIYNIRGLHSVKSLSGDQSHQSTHYRVQRGGFGFPNILENRISALLRDFGLLCSLSNFEL